MVFSCPDISKFVDKRVSEPQVAPAPGSGPHLLIKPCTCATSSACAQERALKISLLALTASLPAGPACLYFAVTWLL